ncbi:hypothetical protein [Heyndrickxia camelliae]|uniref:Uncharacterized protein n=1 Tax=Heyndrickxia camelliae TaxID=1707093 RepID=A0A2N3LG65_9BACI|nr:hypothetical protein [Heyndrickxia camelliae]PKR83554.1 hypothetical protein CWO92_18490 [Heyndrickxia camelliae]
MESKNLNIRQEDNGEIRVSRDADNIRYTSVRASSFFNSNFKEEVKAIVREVLEEENKKITQRIIAGIKDAEVRKY